LIKGEAGRVVSARTAVIAAGGIAAVIAVSVALSGGSKGSPKPPPAPTGSAAAAAPDWSHLVAKVSCDTSGRITVDGYDPASWTHVAQSAFPSPVGVATRLGGGIALDVAGGVGTTLCPSLNGTPETTTIIEAGSLFSPDFSRLSVQIFKQGAWTHVGYITSAGELVDVTAEDKATDAAAAYESGPVFTPDGKTLVYTGATANGSRTLYSRDIASGARATLGTLSGDTGVPLLVGSNRAVTFTHGETAVVAPGGSAVAIGGAVGDSTLSVWHLTASGSADGHGRVDVMRKVAGGPAAEPWQLAACDPVGWVDGSTLLCQSVGAAQDLGAPASSLYTVRLDTAAAAGDAGRQDGQALAVGSPLLPPAANRYFGEPLLIGANLWCVELDSGTSHAESVPVAGGTPTPTPAADPAFSAPGFFLLRGAVRD